MTAATKDGFSARQVCNLVGITYRQLDWWARTDLVPTVADARGSGTQRRYSHHDVLRLAIVKALLVTGVALPSARHALDQLEHAGAGRYLLITGGHVHVAATELEVLAQLRRHAPRLPTVVVALDGITADVDRRIAELHTPVGEVAS